MTVDKFQLLFFGSDQFSTRVLRYLLERQICPIHVVTSRHSVLDKFSVSNQITRYSWQQISNINKHSSHNIGLVASFGHLIHESTIDKFKFGIFNVHPSLLPQYRGSTPVQAAIFNNLDVTGCTIMRIPPVAKFDVGDIILQERLTIARREYAVDLRDRLADLGAHMAENLLLNYDICLQNSKQQGQINKSYAKKLKVEQGHLKFKTDTFDVVDRKVRAYTGFLETYITCLGGLIVRLEGMIEPEEVETYKLHCLVGGQLLCDQRNVNTNYADGIPAPGMIYFHKVRRLICILSKDERWFAFDWATPVGKPRMSATDFYNGYLSKVTLDSRFTDE